MISARLLIYKWLFYTTCSVVDVRVEHSNSFTVCAHSHRSSQHWLLQMPWPLVFYFAFPGSPSQPDSGYSPLSRLCGHHCWKPFLTPSVQTSKSSFHRSAQYSSTLFLANTNAASWTIGNYWNPQFSSVTKGSNPLESYRWEMEDVHERNTSGRLCHHFMKQTYVHWVHLTQNTLNVVWCFAAVYTGPDELIELTTSINSIKSRSHLSSTSTTAQ